MRKYIITVIVSILAALWLLNVAFACEKKKSKCIECPPGIQGEQGEQGDKGDKGDKGESGDNTLKTPYGAGLDVIVWQNKDKTIDTEVQYKYDINNQDHQVYVVAEVNLWEMMISKK